MRVFQVIFLSAALAILVAGCESACENVIAGNTASPSGRTKAVEFHRNCGATTGFNTQVSVLPMAAQLPDEGGNALVIEGSAPLQMRWISDSSLLIEGSDSAKVFKQESRVGEVEISYAN